MLFSCLHGDISLDAGGIDFSQISIGVGFYTKCTRLNTIPYAIGQNLADLAAGAVLWNINHNLVHGFVDPGTGGIGMER